MKWLRPQKKCEIGYYKNISYNMLKMIIFYLWLHNVANNIIHHFVKRYKYIASLNHISEVMSV